MGVLDTRLAYVVAVARAGSFTRAALSVGLTQSAVTRSIADLERQLGYQLFHRSAKGALLTERGRDFVVRAERILDDTRDLMRGLGRPDDPFAVTLRIGVGPSSLEWLLPDALTDLHRRHPELRFDLSSASFERIIHQLLSGSVEVAIGFDAAFADWAEVKRFPLGVLKSTFFARKGHPIHEIERPSDADLAKYEIVTPITRPYIATTRNIFESQGMDWKRHVHVVDAFPVARRIVERSDAIGHVARGYANNPAFKKKFDLIEPLAPYPSAIVCAAVRARSEPAQSTRTFIATLRAKVSTGERKPLSPCDED